MTEVLFIVTRDVEGGYHARAEGPPITVHARTDAELETNVRDAVRAHFDGSGRLPRALHLRYVRDKTIALGTQGGTSAQTGQPSLCGSVLSYDDPFAPACPPADWDANR